MSTYYTAPSAPAAGSRARSALISDIIASIEAGFDALPAGLSSDTDVGAHNDVTDAHSATAAATADRIILRDAQGRAKVAAPDVDGDIVNKGYLGSSATKDVGLSATNVLQANQTEASTATATTTALGTSTTKHLLTGTTTITGFTGTAGVTYHCRADGAFTLTHHATNLIITQTGADITTAAGDTFDVQMITGTTCRIVNYQRATGYPITPPTANRNLIINGGFFINQEEYVSGTNTSGADEYTLDMWRVVTSGQNLTFADSGGKRTVTAPAGGIEQEIEGEFLQAGTYTISWEGTATCAIDATARTSGESFSIAGGSNVTVKFSGGTVANAQLEYGSLETPFEQRSYGAELSLCQRHYIPAVRVGGTGYQGVVTSVRYISTFGPMRTDPTATLTEVTASNLGALSVNQLAHRYVEVTGNTAGAGATIMRADVELDARL